LLRQAAILALGQIGPDAKAAVPVLRNLMKDDDVISQCWPETLIALYQLDPNGKELAEKWLANPTGDNLRPGWVWSFQTQAMVLGAMGRTSFETDWLTSRYLERLDLILSDSNLINGDRPMYLEEWFELISRFGTAARLAVPRLIELRNHSDPWVRMWADEAVAVIAPKENPMPVAPRSTKSVPTSPPPRN